MANIYDMVDTWNAGATTFTAIKMNVTDTASAAGSSLLDLQVGGVSRFVVRKDGNVGIGVAPGALALQIESSTNGSNGFFVRNNSAGSSASCIISANSDSASVTLAAHSAASTAWADAATLTSGTTASGGLQITTATTAPIGFWTNSTARWQFTTAGDLLPAAGNTYNIGSSSFTVASVNAVNLRVASTTGSLTFGAANDVILTRDAADALAQRRTTNPQTFRIYNTFTDSSNYERLAVTYSGSDARIQTEKAGTGTARSLVFGTDANARWLIGATSGHLLAGADNTYDIGASGANRPRNLYMASWIRMATTVVASLPAAATAGAGARMFVTDALTPVFGSAVTGGGDVTVPVYSTGSAWNVG